MLLALVQNGVILRTIYSGETLYIYIPDASIWVTAEEGWTYEDYELVAVVTPDPLAGWLVAAIDVQMIEGVPTTVYTYATLEEHRTSKAYALADNRLTVETGGIVVGGNPVPTTDVNQARLTRAVWLFDHDPTTVSIDWEGVPDVWTTADAAEITAIGVAVQRHVQACASRQRVLSELIAAAASIEDVVAIDIYAGWPPNA